MIHSIPITKARINLGSIIRRVHLDRDYVILEKGGIPIAGILNIEEFEDWLELQDPKLKNQIRLGYQEYQRGNLHSLDQFLSKKLSITKTKK